jgi:hypothetical protein
MRFGVSLARLGLGLGVVFAFGVGACSGGYPLPPTRCDDWCDATKGGECEEWYQPASCVSQCEQSNSDREACRAQFDASVSCFRQSPVALKQLCTYDNNVHDCQAELQALSMCVYGQYPGYGG